MKELEKVEMKKWIQFNKDNNINEICTPLYSLGVKGFFYVKLYHDGTFVDLSTNLYTAEHYFRQFYSCKYQLKDMKDNYLAEGINLWELNKENKIWSDVKNIFNLGNGFSMPLPSQTDHTEIFFYYSDAANYKINDFYLNNLNIFKNFSLYFKEKASKIIKNAENCKITIPAIYRDIYLPVSNEDALIKDYYSKLAIKKFYFSADKYLTYKEAECFYWYANGLTMKQTAQKLGLANKTIESYIDKIKEKVGVINKRSLTKLGIDLGIFDFFDNKLINI